MFNFKILIEPIPAQDGVYLNNPSMENIKWRWEIRPPIDSTLSGRVEISGISNSFEKAKETAEAWADALLQKVSYTYPEED